MNRFDFAWIQEILFVNHMALKISFTAKKLYVVALSSNSKLDIAIMIFVSSQ